MKLFEGLSLFVGVTAQIEAGEPNYCFPIPSPGRSPAYPTAENQAKVLQELQEPEVRRSENGTLRTCLRLDAYRYEGPPEDAFYSDPVLRNMLGPQPGNRFWMRAYENSLPGPTLRVKPGDTLEVTVANNLNNEPRMTKFNQVINQAHNEYRDPDVTNLHTLAHARQEVYVLWATDSTGALIVEDLPGQINERIANLPERVIVFQEFPFRGTNAQQWFEKHFNTSEGSPISFPTNVARRDDFQIQVASEVSGDALLFQGPDTKINDEMLLVNGQTFPQLSLQTGKWYRFRMVFATVAKAMEITFGSCGVRLLQLDGVYVREPTSGLRKVKRVRMYSGSRVDVALQCTGPSQAPHHVVIGNTKNLPCSGTPAGDPEIKHLFRIVTTGDGKELWGEEGREAELPYHDYKFPRYLADLRPSQTAIPDHLLNSDYQVDFRGPPCTMNWQLFKMGDAETSFLLGTVQEWNVTGVWFHPMHLHVNHVQLISGGDEWIQNGDYVDTLALPISGGPLRDGDAEPVVVRFQPEKFTGNYIMHCHTLTHEDTGCMRYVDVFGQEGQPAPVCDAHEDPEGSFCYFPPTFVTTAAASVEMATTNYLQAANFHLHNGFQYTGEYPEKKKECVHGAGAEDTVHVRPSPLGLTGTVTIWRFPGQMI
uniref:Plastocyanin-like domain-containing protein n=1 Tax=Chromera velia CCMP2878 TaxID=1169474 RepID=A0A0G4H9W3_9ALVE|eukprot:Cvel_6034.t1-p1 / transcript=Cvel_6034.t1 / gene=Cvel_6034 / organism=Chromera_velia_CCMP2878 / gene_product=hypothetical protein / transcript_product=hypothetical protein / location=Cvel_scaffold289:83089-87344(+) / protein_length=650 / sequence_SO=supercontig / SO=protein_coding / is_pseudo=false